MAIKGVVKERLLQIVSVTTQVVISRSVSPFKLQLRELQEARRSRRGGGPTPIAWGWDLDFGSSLEQETKEYMKKTRE